MVNDTIGDALTRIRNANLRNKDEVVMPYTRIVLNIMELLKETGYILEASIVDEDGKEVTKVNPSISYKYSIKVGLPKTEDDGKKLIRNIKRVSKPGLRIYKSYKQLKPVLSGYGLSILTTPKGIITDAQARKLKTGGEVICELY